MTASGAVWEVPLRRRAPWLALVAVAAGVGVVVAEVVQDRGYYGEAALGTNVLRGGVVLLALAGLPAAILLAGVRRAALWLLGVLLLSALCVWTPIAISRTDSSTAGLAYLYLPFLGTAGALALAAADAFSSRPRGRGPAGRPRTGPPPPHRGPSRTAWSPRR